MSRFIKSHGLGNDDLISDSTLRLTPARVQALCDRHEGIGGDGILEELPSARAAYGLRIWNPDGSLAEKSGNGLRIFADWLVRARGAPRAFSVWTAGGVVRCEVGEQVRVAMGRARSSPTRVRRRCSLRICRSAKPPMRARSGGMVALFSQVPFT